MGPLSNMWKLSGAVDMCTLCQNCSWGLTDASGCFLECAGEYAIAPRLRVNATSNVGPYDADGGRRQGSGFEKKDDFSLDQ